MYAENYPRYRAPPGGGDAPPQASMGGGGGGPPPSAMLAPPPPGRPRGVPRGGAAYDAMNMAPDELAKSLQPPGRGYVARRVAAPAPRGGGGEQWSPTAAYGGGYGGGGYAPPPAKYRRTAGEFEGVEDRAAYRVNSYDLSTRDGGPRGAMYAPSQQQPMRAQRYAQYAPPSPQQEMLQRRRLAEQERFSPVAYRGPPSSSSSSMGPSPRGAAPAMSSAAAAWARELDPYDNARRIHRELQPPTANGGRAGGPVTPQAHLRMQRMGASGFENSPGSRIVTPAAALQNAQRPGEWARRTPMTNARGPPAPGLQPSLSYDEIDAMAMQMPMARARSLPPGPVAYPPAVTAQFSMPEYEAVMQMERELGAPRALPEPRSGNAQLRPTSAGSNGRARGRQQGVSPARGAPTTTSLGEPAMDAYMMQQANEYAMPVAAPMPAVVAAPPKPARQSKAAREAAALAQSQAPPQAPQQAAPASKKRKEPAAGKRKARESAEDMESASGGQVEPRKSASKAKASTTESATADGTAEPKRRCGRKSMNYSSEQKRERNRAAVKKCRQRQALKYEYLKRKADVLASENRALSEMLVKNVELDDDKRNSLTRGIQMDILLKIKEIFTQSLPKDFVLDADSIWDLNSVLAVSMPSRCYYGIESIKDFWRTSLRMRNKGKIRSFWAWLFRLPPGDRFAEFTITPFSPTSNLYFINWTTKSTPALSGSIVIMFGHGHRVTLHVEIFGWLIWRYLLTNTPFPEPPIE